ncbi:hypothetical protein EB001_19340 [bacterium]|nr:hypothetical protein [bacterium]
MQVKDLDGVLHKWHLTGNISKGKILNKSSFHLRARQLISSLYPTMQLLEEVTIPLRKNETLYLDFYLPLKKLCVEVHGEQHYKFIPFYHSTQLSFLKSQKRDREKEEWCSINDIQFVALPHFEDDAQWMERLKNA